MTEQEYIKTKALGTITSAIQTLNDLAFDNLSGIIKESEGEKVIKILYGWQEKLFKEIEVSNHVSHLCKSCTHWKGLCECAEECDGYNQFLSR